jgi:SulP family sulfate permease
VFSKNFSQEWFCNIRADLLAGLVVALALIPEAIAFSIIAGVDPKVGLYASFCIAVVTAFFGGRPAMISAATGAMALLMVTLVKEHGLQYLLVATLLTGVFQIIAGTGAHWRCDALRVEVGDDRLRQCAGHPHLHGAAPRVQRRRHHHLCDGRRALAIIYILPRFTKAVPSPLVAIIVMTIIAIVFKLDVRRVGDLGDLPDVAARLPLAAGAVDAGDAVDRAALLRSASRPLVCWSR